MHVPEPTIEETYEILQGLRERYESHHKLRYTDEALMAAAKYSSQYISDRFLPDKAIDLIDEAGSRVRLRHIQLPEEARELDKELKQVGGGGWWVGVGVGGSGMGWDGMGWDVRKGKQQQAAVGGPEAGWQRRRACAAV